MILSKRTLPLITIAFLILLLVSGCQSTDSDSDKLKVATGILPMKAFVEQIGGNHVVCEALIPLGANPHNYQPTPSSMKFLSEADLYIYTGVPTENENIVPKISDFNDHIGLVNLQAALAKSHPFLIGDEHHHDEDENHDAEHEEDVDHSHDDETLLYFEAVMLDSTDTIGAYAEYDPHTWVSPTRAITMVKTITEALKTADPQNTQTYEKNAAALIEDLESLDSEIKSKVETLTQKTYLIYHSSYNYFAFDYGLSFVSIENEGKSPTIQDIRHAIDTANEYGIHTLFYQNEFSVEQAKSISEEIDGDAVPLEPLSEDYFGSMQKLLKALN